MLQSQAAVVRLKPAPVLQPLAIQVVAQRLIQAAVHQFHVHQLAKQPAVHQLPAATAATAVAVAVAIAVVAEASASKCQSSVAQKFVAQSSVAQRSACLSATSVAAADADAVHHAVHLVAQLANQAAVHQLQLHVLALATDIKSAKG